MISLYSVSCNFNSNYSRSFDYLKSKSLCCFSIRYFWTLYTLSCSFRSRLLSSLRKSRASSTLSSRETSFSWVYRSFSFFLGFTFMSSVSFERRSSSYCISLSYVAFSCSLLYFLNFLPSVNFVLVKVHEFLVISVIKIVQLFDADLLI